MSEEIKAVRELIASLPNTAGMSIHEFRTFMNKTAASLHLPRGASVETIDADGVPAEWVKTLKTNNDSAILYLHGGGYVAGSTAFSRQLAAYISINAEAPLLLLSYRFVPENPFPAALDDAINDYRWLVGKGISLNRIAITGDSTILSPLCI
jgi:acetyl esterase/lipase